jgi:predicted membrane metal-binding protein
MPMARIGFAHLNAISKLKVGKISGSILIVAILNLVKRKFYVICAVKASTLKYRAKDISFRITRKSFVISAEWSVSTNKV